MKNIGIDIDGCLTDVYNWYLKNGEEYYNSINKKLVNKNEIHCRKLVKRKRHSLY